MIHGRTCAEGQHRDGRLLPAGGGAAVLGVLDAVQAGQDPADGAVAADDQDAQVRDVPEQLQRRVRALPRQLHHLRRDGSTARSRHWHWLQGRPIGFPLADSTEQHRVLLANDNTNRRHRQLQRRPTDFQRELFNNSREQKVSGRYDEGIWVKDPVFGVLRGARCIGA